MRDLDDRVVTLEREVRRLTSELGRYMARDSAVAPRLQQRIAKVTALPATGDNTFRVIFVETDGEVENGAASIDFIERQTVSETHVVGIYADELPDDDEHIPVFWHDDNWWTDYRKSSSLVLVTADADIEHAATGTCSVATVGDDTNYEVYNGRDKLWSGAEALIGWNKTKGRWQVVQAWSATRIRGTVQAQINPGLTGTLTSVTALNGHFSPTTATVLMPTNHVQAKINMKAWAEIVWTGTESQWQIYAVDCNG